MDSADGGQILVSSTVRSLLLGSSWKFESAGTRTLKGIEGDWELYELA